MSQYGAEKLLYGATLVPTLDTETFVSAKQESPIVCVMIIDDHGCDHGRVRELDQAMRGKPYSDWLALENDHEFKRTGHFNSSSGVRKYDDEA